MKNSINDIAFFKQQLNNKLINLEKAKVYNEQFEALQVKCLETKAVQDKLVDYVTELSLLKSMIISEAKAFKERRIQYLNDSITEELGKIFPEEGFTAKIVCDFKYNNNKAYLTLIDKSGNVRIPKISEGKLCQYLISFSSTVGTVKGLGKRNIYIDEAFGVSSPQKLLEVSTLLNDVLESGIQLVVISQHKELYQDLPRREIHLYKNPDTGVTSVEDIVEL